MVKRSESAPLDFKGFSAFADHTSAASAAVQQMSRRRSSSTLHEPTASPTSTSTSPSSSPPLRPSPVYLGNDPQLTIIFRSIGQKKDATTKIRSMVELASRAFPVTYNNTDSTSSSSNKFQNYTVENPKGGELKKSDQITALSHFFFLFQTKLIQDNNPLVRSEAIKVLGDAVLHVPKAFLTLLLYHGTGTQIHADDGDSSASNTPSPNPYEQLTGLGVGNIVGHVYAAKCLSDSTVSPVASMTFSRIQSIGQEREPMGVETQWTKKVREYIVGHIEAVLHYSSRPVMLNDALMGKINTLSSSNDIFNKSTTKNASSVDTSTMGGGGGGESDREDVEERYERTVVSCLKALGCMFQEYPEKSWTGRSNDVDRQDLYSAIFKTPSILWKHMNSSRATFRRETYNGISSACQNGLSLVHHPLIASTDGTKTLPQSKIQGLITQSIVSERDMSNFPALFELLLVYVHTLKQLSSQSEMGNEISSKSLTCPGTVWDDLKLDALVKALVKPLKQACYGSSARQWAPILLPVIASIPNHLTLQLPVVKNLWEGRYATTVHADKLAIVSAVAEICGYLLVCEATDDDSKDSNSIRDVAQLLTESLSFYLMEPVGGSSSLESSKNVCKISSKVLVKLDRIPSDDNKYRFSHVQSFFWNEGIPTAFIASALDDTSVTRLSSLVDDLLVLMGDRESYSERSSYFRPVFKSVFGHIMALPQGQISNSKIGLVYRIFTLCGAAYILSNDGDNVLEPRTFNIETFVMNTMLTWLIPRVSSMGIVASDQTTNKDIFSLLFLILVSVSDSEEKKKIWEAFVNELIRAGVQLGALTTGISVLVSLAEERGIFDFSPVVIQCSVLNSFVLRLGQTVMKSRYDEATHGAEDEASSETDNFLSFHGISDKDINNKRLYEDFLSLCLGISSQRSSTSLISSETIKDLITLFTSSREDSLLKERPLILLEVLLESQSVQHFRDEDDIQVLLLTAWKQGGLIWETAKVKALSENNEYLISAFIDGSFHVLLETLSKPIPADRASSVSVLWSQRAWRLYEVYRPYECKDLTFARRSGIGNSVVWMAALGDTDTSRRDLLYMCLTLFLKNFDQANDRCACLLGRDNWNVDLMAVLLSALCLPISVYWSPSLVSRCEEVFSLLQASQNMPNSFHESVALHLLDSLCKLLESTNVSEREVICMMAALDFSLGHLVGRIVFDSAAAPLHRLKQDGSRIDIDQDLSLFIVNIESRMHENIIKRYFAQPHETKTSIQLEIAAETCNLIISRCGLTGKAGLGSRKYDLFVTLTSICDHIKNSLTSSRMEKSDSALLSHLSQAMGYGRITAPSKQNFLVLNVDYKSILDLMPTYLNEQSLTKELCASLVIFVSTFSPLIETDKVRNEKAWIILDKVSSSIYDRHDQDEQAYYCLLLLKAIDSIKISQNNSYSKPCLAEVRTRTRLLLLCSRNQNCRGLADSTKQKEPSFQDFYTHAPDAATKRAILINFEAFLDDTLTLPDGIVVAIGQGCVEELYLDLYSGLQWKLFGLFMVVARKGNQLYTETTPCLSKNISSRLEHLSFTMASVDDVDELKEDFLVSANWFPQRLMIDLESWDDKYDSTPGDDIITSRFLAWLLCLEILDNASRTDIRNRSHLSSYLETTSAISVIMELVLICTNFQERDSSEWMACISSLPRQSLRLSQLASLIAFRTFESIPTLMKKWYNDDCPKALQSCVAKFVETKVSTHTLKRELDRLKRAENLSDLVINGSNVSREVSATYIQDECHLSVLIHVPPLFPLKNVNVDCKKTYGVSEKRWRHWSLQIMKMLNSQDGSILDALLLWKKSVDKEFEGVEPCPVCYSVLSVKTHSMPNIECKTCHNKFHNHCLFKWFQSSGKNLCVLCQQPWAGSRIS